FVLDLNISDISGLTQAPHPNSLRSLTFQAPFNEDNVETLVQSIQEVLRGELKVLVQEEPLDCLSSMVRQELFVTITDFSYRDMNLLFGSEDREDLLGLTIKSVLSLPAISTPTQLPHTGSSQSSHPECLYRQMFQAFSVMLQSLVHMEPWLQSDKDHERERATTIMSQILKCLSSYLNLK
ncbi:hypothetical protein U0070_010149, partial [Myodes glareolus]